MNGKVQEKKDTKVVLLFVPEELSKNYTVLQTLHIQKSASSIGYSLNPLNRGTVAKYFDALPQGGLSVLLKFQSDALVALRQETEQRYKKQKAGVPLQDFLRQSVHRHLHQLFRDFIHHLGSIKCYHKIRKQGSGGYLTRPCTFGDQRPRLQFEVIREDGVLGVRTQIIINDKDFDLCLFNRTAFFLEKEDTYYQLSFADYQTLEWLEQRSTQPWGYDEALFAEQVLARLEKDYSVNRNSCFAEQVIQELPVCRVLLTELNNSFLMLTPQFLYDGVLVDGPFKERQEMATTQGRVLITRHRETECRFRELLFSLHPLFATQLNGYYYLSFAEAQKKQWFAKAFYQLLEMDIEVVGMDLLRHFKYSSHKAETSVTIEKESGTLVRLQLTVRFGKETISLTQLQKTLWAGGRAVVLRDGSLGVLSDEWLQRYALIVKHGKVSGGTLEVSRLLTLGDFNPESDKPVVEPRVIEGWWDRWQHWQSSSDPIYELPATIKAKLRPYQQKGFEWLALLAEAGAGGCLADDMGLGKTLQTISFLAWYLERYPQARHLVVCPTSLLYNWQEELKKFAPALFVSVYHGAARNIEDDGVAKAQVVITSYGMLRSNPDVLLKRSYGVAVLDESHTIKNPSAQVSRITQAIEAEVHLALSGTPVVNNTFDLYAQLNFTLPGFFGSREFFKREYADPIDRWGDEGKIKALQRLTAPFVLRRTKEQVAPDLPSKTEAVLWCTMSPSQEELYQEVREQVRSSLFGEIEKSGLGKAKLAVLQGLLKLRQICNDPKLLPAEEHSGRLDSIKTDVLIDELEQVLGVHKALVFSQFASMLHLLAKVCDQKGVNYFLLDGSTPAERRAQMVREFQESPDSPHLFFISLKAGNTGLTLTAADYVFLFDPWWNRAVEEQAIDRTHRIGQTKCVFSYKLICRNTVEERILDLQARKKQLANELISEEGFVKTLSEEDIAFLFQ
jgi:superfamily II DNA or RNA helicase